LLRRRAPSSPLFPYTTLFRSFQVENALAAVGAAWSLGLPPAMIRAGLSTFLGDQRQAPGRFNLLHVAGATVIVDFAHNTSALARSEEHTSELQSLAYLVCRLL